MMTAMAPGAGPARTRRRRAAAGVAAALAFGFVLTAASGPARASGIPAAAQSWPVAGQNIGNTRDQAAETAISAINASQLTQKWALTTAGDVTATPTMVNNVLYFPDMGGKLWAVTSAGKVVWSNPVSSYTGITGDVSRDSPATGTILWQTPDPQSRADFGYVSVADGVVYGGSNAPAGDNMFALNASTGAFLWSFPSGGAVRSGAAIVGSQVYWGTGYKGADNNKIYAFGLPGS